PRPRGGPTRGRPSPRPARPQPRPRPTPGTRRRPRPGSGPRSRPPPGQEIAERELPPDRRPVPTRLAGDGQRLLRGECPFDGNHAVEVDHRRPGQEACADERRPPPEPAPLQVVDQCEGPGRLAHLAEHRYRL